VTAPEEKLASRREQSKAARRDAIFEATRDLLRLAEGGVSAEQIARRAGVSTATVYNLIGPREELLGALLSHLFERLYSELDASGVTDPLGFGEAVVTRSVALFCEDPVVWRHVMHEISGAYAERIAPHVSRQPVELQVRAMREARALGLLAKGADPDAAAMQIYASYNGALFMWAGGFLTDEDFLRQALSGFWTVVAAHGARAERQEALRVLARLGHARTGGSPAAP
jgi:AcrR family transcriptional regulator